MNTYFNCAENPNHHLYPIQKRVDQRDRSDSKVSGKSAGSGNLRRASIFPSEQKTGQGQKENARRVLQKVNYEGIARYNQAQSIIGKIFWILLALFFVALGIRGFVQNIHDYIYSPIATTYTISTPNELEFPDVYICMGNAFSSSYLRKHPEMLSDSSVFDSLVGGSKRKKRSVGEEVDEDVAKYYVDAHLHYVERIGEEEILERFRRSENQSKKLELYDVVTQGGFKVNKTFLSCEFNAHEKVQLDCNEIVKPIVDPNYYLCYVVKVPSDYKQVRARKGLSLLINSQVSDYPTGVNDTTANAIAGLYLSISDRFDPTNWYKTMIRPGYYTKVDLSATHVHLINLESGALIQPCVEDGRELYKLFNTSYSRTACQMDCMLYTYYQTCDCILMMDRSILNSTLNASFCTPKQAQGCVKQKIINSTEKMQIISDCAKVCNTPCDSIRYEMRSSKALLTDKIRQTLLHTENLNLTIPTKDYIRLDVSFRRMELAELIQAESKTLAQLIGDMGGTMNFWLGASIIALVESLTVVFGGCFYICMKKCRKSENISG